VDPRAREALRDFVRTEMSRDFDSLVGEVEARRREVVQLERMVGLPGEPLPRRQRRAKVAELRSRGYSSRAIAQLLGIDRATVLKDVRALGPPASVVVGLDGRAVKGPRSPATADS
jgi:DNA-binding NarL/FixJ family response regulator